MIREKISLARMGKAAGRTPWRNVSNENAWAAMIVEGTMGTAVLKFIVTSQYPLKRNNKDERVYNSPANIPQDGVLPAGTEYTVALDSGDSSEIKEVSAVGLYPFPRLLGSLWGCIEYAGVDGDTDLDVSVTTQMV